MRTFKAVRSMKRALTLFLVMLMLATSMPIVARADTTQDSKDALAQARKIFRLADDGDFNAMYDLIHPDARELIPRITAVNTFQAIYGAEGVGRGVPTGVEFGSWTWGVTGKKYPNAAAVSFEQPYAENGEDKTLNDTMYLVRADDGEWRWFFGSTPEFVTEAIKMYGGSASTTPITEGDVINNVINDLDTFYRGAFKYTDLTYKSPAVVVVSAGDSEQTACGPAQTGFWAFYCPGDVTVYLDEAFLSELGKKAPFAEAFVIAHEWAHHIQTAIGLRRVEANEQPSEWNDVFSIELELMADCMAGAWAQDVGSRGLLNPDDIDQTVAFTIQYLGDPDYISDYDPQAHGSADQRKDAILAGYNNGFLACNITV
jgi:predicted metalloprotease